MPYKHFIAIHIHFRNTTGEMTALAQNDVVLVFRSNVLYTAFIPADREYFGRSVETVIRKSDDDGTESQD